ncbi:hypothetical protein CHCC5025_1177 [Bacillus licheniformis]|nr:hypothetical protein CHCC5025_1177 [Bacillus licheniformis]TWK70862.1 hypothetical protein CHCC20342_2529 [Bacillus licheniformis]TWM98325.1 hypothetical protein CHCC14596_4365 [Bacillus licheniformis]
MPNPSLAGSYNSISLPAALTYLSFLGSPPSMAASLLSPENPA